LKFVWVFCVFFATPVWALSGLTAQAGWLLPTLLLVSLLLLFLFVRSSREVKALRAYVQFHKQQPDPFRMLHDEVTGFPNKIALEQQLTLLLQRDPSQHYSLLLLKIKDFEQINKALGRSNANLLLTQIAARMNQLLVDDADVLKLEWQSQQASIVHLGGVDFAAWVHAGRKQHQAEYLAQRIEQMVPEPLLIHGCAIEYRIASGVAHYPQHGTLLNELMDKAYQALQLHLYRFSDTQVFSTEMQTYNDDKLIMMSQLSDAIVQQQLQLDVQPQMDLSTQQVLAAEVLVRWQHPERGLLLPKDFLPLAEEMGMIYPLTQWVLKQAIVTLQQLRQQGFDIALAVNLASSDLLQMELVEQLQQMLEDADVPATALILEIREEALLTDPEKTLLVLQRLRQLGVSLALDDFGTGLSSLGYIRKLPIQQVKVDCSFVAGLHRSDTQAAVTGAILDVAKNLQLVVVAEGIEEQAVADRLIKMGCQRGQGFLYSRPFALHGLPSWLKQWFHQRNQ
jgi:EAL domain-containing protein (putative c-di-GMP-specific phosphodiesterase class I)/GGDEF domain-containing protein